MAQSIAFAYRRNILVGLFLAAGKKNGLKSFEYSEKIYKSEGFGEPRATRAMANYASRTDFQAKLEKLRIRYCE